MVTTAFSIGPRELPALANPQRLTKARFLSVHSHAIRSNRSERQAFTPFTAPGLDYATTTNAVHAWSKSVFFLCPLVMGLKGAFHDAPTNENALYILINYYSGLEIVVAEPSGVKQKEKKRWFIPSYKQPFFQQSCWSINRPGSIIAAILCYM